MKIKKKKGARGRGKNKMTKTGVKEDHGKQIKRFFFSFFSGQTKHKENEKEGWRRMRKEHRDEIEGGK